jgi:hypothetical protein
LFGENLEHNPILPAAAKWEYKFFCSFPPHEENY